MWCSEAGKHTQTWQWTSRKYWAPANLIYSTPTLNTLKTSVGTKTSVFPVTWDKEPESGRQSESVDDNSSNKHEDRDVWCQSAVWTQQLVLPRPYPWRHDWKPSERMRSSTEAIINIATFTLQYIIHYCLVICSIPMLFIWLTSDSKWTWCVFLLQKD